MPQYQLLVRVKDKTNADPLLDVKCLKAGDVVAYKPADSAWWTTRELTNPEWMLLNVDISAELAESLVEPQPPPDLAKSYRMLKRRSISLDLPALGINLPNAARVNRPELVNQALLLSVLKIKERQLEQDEIVT
jgi:hypothetical protein